MSHHPSIIVFALWASVCAAQPLTLEAAERRAVQASPSLQQATEEVGAAHQRRLQAWARHLGELDMVAMANHFEAARAVRPIAGPLTPATTGAIPWDANQLHAGAVWQVPLFAGGGLLAGDRSAELLEQGASALRARTEAEVRAQTRAVFRNALAAQHSLDELTPLETALAEAVQATALRVQTNASTEVDTLKVRFAAAGVRTRRAQLEAQRSTALAQLAALMGEAQLPEQLVETDEPIGALPAPQRPVRDDIEGLQLAAASQDARASAVRAGFWPQLALTGGVFFNAGLATSAVEPSLEVSLVLKVPVFGAIARIPMLREAEHGAAQARARWGARTLEARTQVEDARGRVATARTALEVSEAQRALGAEVARIEKLKLDTGSGRIEDYLLALSQSADADAAQWQAKYALLNALDAFALAQGHGETP